MVITASAVTSITPPSAPAGWSSFLSETNGLSALPCGLWIFSKIAAGGDTAPSTTVTTSGTTRVGTTLLEFAAVNTTTPIDTSGVGTNGTVNQANTSITQATAGVVQAGASGYALAITVRFQSVAAAVTWTQSAGWTTLEGDAATSVRGHNFIDILAAPPAGSVLSETSSTASNQVVYSVAVVVLAAANLTLSSADTGTGTDAGETIRISDTDTGAGADGGEQVPASLSGSDTGLGAETQALSGLTQPELLAAQPGPAWLAHFQPGRKHKPQILLPGNPSVPTTPVSDSDTGSGLDAQALTAAVPSADTGSGLDASTIAATLASADTGLGTDAAGTVAAALSGTDTASGADAGEKIAFTSTDTGLGTDAGTASVPVTSPDTGSGTDAAGTVAATLASTDPGLGTDSAGTVAATLASLDTGSAADVQALAVSLPDADTGTAVETAILVSRAVTDTGTATDAGEKLAPAGSDAGSAADAGEQARVSSTDAASVADAGSATTAAVPVSDGDTGTFRDAGSRLFATFAVVAIEIFAPAVDISVDSPAPETTILDPYGDPVSE